MASPNTLKLMEERNALRAGKVKILKPFLIYGANRKTRRSQLRQVYKEAFPNWTEAKRAVREQDQEKLQKYSAFAKFLVKRTKELQEEARAKGEELTEEQAFEVIKKEAHENNLAEQKRLAEEQHKENFGTQTDSNSETSA